MQAATAGDQYSWALVQADGTTPLTATGVASIAVAISGPYLTQAAALAAPFTAGASLPASLTTPPPTANWVTTIAGNNSAKQTTYPTGGWYAHQIVIDYTAGAIAKSQVFALQIQDSII